MTHLKELLFILVLCCAVCTSVVAQSPVTESQSVAKSAASLSIAGKWQGVLKTGRANLKIELRFTEKSAGQYGGAMDIPEAGGVDLQFEQLTYSDHILSFDVNIGAPSHIEGAVSRDNTEFTGTLTQGGGTIPLSFTRLDSISNPLPNSPVVSNPKRKLDLQPCGMPGLTKDALCGNFEVYEDRAKMSGRKIKLFTIVLPALVDKPAPDPVFYLVGGPGGAATESANSSFMARLRRTRDVVLVDQRGTGKSNQLQCDFHKNPDDIQSYFGDGPTLDDVRKCRADLEKIADLRLYTTTIAMADLDDVRIALGYDKINVYGGSYGATTSLAYLIYYPQNVRTVTVSGVAPPDSPLPLSFAKGVEHALNRLFDDCAADEKCNAAFPELRKDWAATVSIVQKGPVSIDALNPFTLQKQHVTMTRDGFAELIRIVLYVPPVMNMMPAMIHQMAGGDFSQFATYSYQVQRQVSAGIARGMHFSVVCAEDIPFIKESEIEPATAGTFYGASRTRSFMNICKEWPRGEMPAKYREPIKSKIPVLMLSGELDPVTPPDVAKPLLQWLPNSKQVLVHFATHYSYACMDRLAREFIESGTLNGLDTSCIDEVRRLPFVTTLRPLEAPK